MAETWTAMSHGLLRQAGFALDTLDPLAHDLAAELSAIRAATGRATELADRLAKTLRQGDVGGRQRALSRLGLLRDLTGEDTAGLPADVAAPLTEYQDAVLALKRSVSALEQRHAAALEDSRHHVARLFREDPALRQVLLLSNEAHYPRFEAWLDRDGEMSDRTARRMTDLLTMYLQRVASKNETTSHFGPVSVASLTTGAEAGTGDRGADDGLDWTDTPIERVAFFSHWAAERLAETFSADPRLRGHVRPRLRPLAFRDGDRIDLFAFRTETGMPGDWRFVVVGSSPVDEAADWLWRHCDARRTVGELHRDWAADTARPGTDLDEALRRAAADGWLVTVAEIPIGAVRPLETLRELVAEAGGEASDLGAALDRFDRFLAEFPLAAAADRPALLASLRSDFETLTGGAAERPGGTHYADRSLFYEEAHGPQRDLTVGPGLTDFVTGELTPVYGLVLLAPRLRMRRERAILTRWAQHRFALGTDVPLHHFYQAFFADRPELEAACAEVDAEIAAVERELRQVLLPDGQQDLREVRADRARLEELIARHAGDVPALCSPDVMLAARDLRALADGDFTAVVGDCHALRDPLTHSSLAPLLAARADGIVAEAQQRYQDLLDPDEVIVDLARAHLDKTGAQLAYPCLDVEVHGRSGKPRDRVVQPAQLSITVTPERLELRARGVSGRLRLKSPFAGGPGIRHDPLSVFAFPRHFGGIGIRTDDLAHVPRIRCGRVVLRRESWRVPVAELRPWSPGGHPVAADAAAHLGAVRLRERLGLPRHCFVKIPGEPKPVFLDWEAPLLVRQLVRLAKGTEGALEFSEMLPGPDELWLDVAGHRHTSELRCTVFSRTDAPPA
ncbi:lantibiotic dehydratase [Kitasatospora sp. NPDC091335]|uniref:lantibiotic dehydratase n=1 Tax=Kitasatospora sp. NPDC091335 TaxID=3364085 RepID=UPI0038276A70